MLIIAKPPWPGAAPARQLSWADRDSDDPSAFGREVTRTQELLGALTHPDRLFRPYCNAGQPDHRVFKHRHVEQLLQGGYSCVMFDAVVQDWEDADGWVDRALTAINERPWTTLILRDVIGQPAGRFVNGMEHLDRFLSLLGRDEHEIVQKIRPDSMPILRGELVRSVEHLCS